MCSCVAIIVLWYWILRYCIGGCCRLCFVNADAVVCYLVLIEFWGMFD